MQIPQPAQTSYEVKMSMPKTCDPDLPRSWPKSRSTCTSRSSLLQTAAAGCRQFSHRLTCDCRLLLSLLDAANVNVAADPPAAIAVSRLPLALQRTLQGRMV